MPILPNLTGEFTIYGYADGSQLASFRLTNGANVALCADGTLSYLSFKTVCPSIEGPGYLSGYTFSKN